MATRPSLRSVPPDRRSQIEAIRKREDDALITASKAETALKAAQEGLDRVIAEHKSQIDQANVDLAGAYRGVVDAFGSRSRAVEYLNVTESHLRRILAAAPTDSTASGPGTGSDVRHCGEDETRQLNNADQPGSIR